MPDTPPSPSPSPASAATAAPSRLERNLGVALMLLLLAGCYVVMRPFLSALAWSCVMGFSLWPLHRRLVDRFRGRRTLAALALTGAIALIFVVPTVVLVINLADDARDLATATKEWFEAGSVAPPPAWLKKIPVVGDRAAAYWRELAADATRMIDRARNPAPPTVDPTTQPIGQTKLGQALSLIVIWARQWLPVIAATLFGGVTEILLSVALTFFILRDGAHLAARLATAVARVGGARGAHLLTVAGSTVRGVVYGILGTALVQGLLAAFGFLIAGVPGAALLGLITFFLSVVPLGPPLVWLPAALWLFHRGQTGWGVFMIVWGLLVSSVDNVIKPMIISRGSGTPFLLILFGVLGGALSFGLIGVFLGPTLLAVAYRLMEDWVTSDGATA